MYKKELLREIWYFISLFRLQNQCKIRNKHDSVRGRLQFQSRAVCSGTVKSSQKIVAGSKTKA